MTDSIKLVDQQLRLVEIRRDLERSGELPHQVRVDDVHYGPCVLFSRECGSAGDDVAQLVGERLHWPVFDPQIVAQIAERAHVRNQLVERVDEHIRARWRRLLHPIRERQGLKPETYLYHLHEIVLSLGHLGYVVIVGRGAQFLLPPACALRVRVIEPLASRVRRISSARQLSSEAAMEWVKKCEADRIEFIRTLFHQDTTSPLQYDLVLNTGTLSPEVATVTVLMGLQKKLGVRLEPNLCAN